MCPFPNELAGAGSARQQSGASLGIGLLKPMLALAVSLFSKTPYVNNHNTLFALHINHTKCSPQIKLEPNFPKNFITLRRPQNTLKINELLERSDSGVLGTVNDAFARS